MFHSHGILLCKSEGLEKVRRINLCSYLPMNLYIRRTSQQQSFLSDSDGYAIWILLNLYRARFRGYIFCHVVYIYIYSYLGFLYKKIDACLNNCMLYWMRTVIWPNAVSARHPFSESEVQWENNKKKKKLAPKRLCYLPLKPRL